MSARSQVGSQLSKLQEYAKVKKNALRPIYDLRTAAVSARCEWNNIISDLHATSHGIAWMRIDSIRAVRTVHAHLHLLQRRAAGNGLGRCERDGEVEGSILGILVPSFDLCFNFWTSGNNLFHHYCIFIPDFPFMSGSMHFGCK